VIAAHLGTAFDVERLAVLNHTQPDGNSVTTPYLLVSDGVGDTPSWVKYNLPTPPNPLFKDWATMFFDNWVTHEGDVRIIDNIIHVFISSYYEFHDDDVDEDRLTGKIWDYQLTNEDPTWVIEEFWEGPLDFKLKGTIATEVEGRIGLFINGINIQQYLTPGHGGENSNFLFEWFFWTGDEPPIQPSDTLEMSDSIQLRLDGSSLPNQIVLDKCPVNIINSELCTGFKLGQVGSENPLACPPKFFEISKEQCS